MGSYMKPKNTPTTFTLANKSLRNGEYIEAISLYSQAIDEHSAFKEHIQHNIQTAIRRLSGLSPATMKSYAVTLTPVSQIEHDTEDAGYWHSLGEDPHFQLRFDDAADLDAGWYCIDLLVDSLKENNLAKFYLDYGQGYAEDAAFNLSCRKLTLETRVVHVRKHAHAVRFDPKETSGRFRIMTLQWRKVEESSAIEQMFAQLADESGSSSHAARQAMRGDFEQLALKKNIAPLDVLYEKYNKLFQFIPGQVSYEQWIEHIEKPSLPSPAEARELFEGLHHKPLISVVMATYNTDEDFLRACINSVLAQSYQKWELCIADDASSKPNVREILEAYAIQDARIKIVVREKNGHISHASNSALALANGEFIALLDHDDALPKHALLFVAQAINATPDAQIIYSDEDKISADGQRFAPHFKSDWNPDLFYSHNYVSHLGVYRRALLERIGGFRAGVEGSQDYDLLLRCLPHVADRQIIHIPRVLYHWRTVKGSTALASGEKSYTTEAGIKALTDYFAQTNPAVGIEQGPVPNTYRVRWPIPTPAPLVSLLIPTRDRRNLVEVAVRSILEKSTYTNFEILILDNGSVEVDTLAFFAQIQKEDPRVRVLRYDHPFNYSAINNFGVRQARGEIIGLINNDIEVISPEWLTEMVSHAIRPEIGCVGAKLYYSNDTIQHAGVICSIGGVAGHSHKHFPRSHLGYFSRLILVQTLSAVTAACLLVRKSIFVEVVGLDENNLKVAFNDVDFCLKVGAAGYRNIWTPYAELYHYESVSRGAEDSPEKIRRFQGELIFMKGKWSKELTNDPYYNPNLTKEREDFSISQPQ